MSLKSYNTQHMLAVLGYHKIGEPSADGWHTWSYVSAEIFEQHLHYLKDNNWRVLNFEEFISAIEEPGLLPGKSILITFDDGYRSTLEIALPILIKFNYPAVVFIATS